MDQDRMDFLLARYLAGGLSPEESEELEWAMLANPALRVTLQVLARMKELPSAEGAAGEREMMERGLQRIYEEADAMPREVMNADEMEKGLVQAERGHVDIGQWRRESSLIMSGGCQGAGGLPLLLY